MFDTQEIYLARLEQQAEMYDMQEIYLARLEQQDEEIVTCPHCESYLVEHQDNFTYVCLDCLNEFSINPLADDESIPF